MRYTIPRAPDPVDPEYLRLFQDLDRTVSLLDSRYVIPFTRVRFGWDAIVGLVPVVGDALSAAVGFHLVHRAWCLGADGRVASRMVLNIAIDTLIGAIPIVGTVFDVYFRANERNLQLLIEHTKRHRQS